jgi:hypothetical protein
LKIRHMLKSIPVIGPALVRWKRGNTYIEFDKSGSYWERRYAVGGNSGAGSYNRLAQFKADFINKFVAEHDVQTIIEYGSGDGAQLKLSQYPSYIGIDVSKTILEKTKKEYLGYQNFSFVHTDDVPIDISADLTLSLDVIYHLIEDDVFDKYMSELFKSSRKYVIIYSSNENKDWPADHVRHRKFTDWIETHESKFSLINYTPNIYPWRAEDVTNTSFADFYIFERRNT